MHIMQVKNWKYMLQKSENYSNIQEPMNQKKKKIFHNRNFKTEYAVHLMECAKCNL